MTSTCPICRGARFIDKFDGAMGKQHLDIVGHERMPCFMCNQDGRASEPRPSVGGNTPLVGREQKLTLHRISPRKVKRKRITVKPVDAPIDDYSGPGIPCGRGTYPSNRA